MLTRDPVVQIHPSRFCNYQCVHCYSSSGPKAPPSLDVSDILRTTENLAAQGYTRAALSGGEPVLFPDFAVLIRGLSEQGFSVSVITNGSRPDPLLAACSAGHIHHTAVSFDGMATLHDAIRKKTGAFRAAVDTMHALRAGNYSRGAVLSVTQQSMPQLPDTVSAVVDAGAMHIQLHPLAAIGRARQNANHIGQELPEEALLRMLVLKDVLRLRHPDVAFQCDVITGAGLAQSDVKLGALISPLVLCDDGVIVPYAFDFARHRAVGQVGNKAVSCKIDATLSALLTQTINRLSGSTVTNFYRELVLNSQAASQSSNPRSGIL